MLLLWNPNLSMQLPNRFLIGMALIHFGCLYFLVFTVFAQQPGKSRAKNSWNSNCTHLCYVMCVNCLCEKFVNYFSWSSKPMYQLFCNLPKNQKTNSICSVPLFCSEKKKRGWNSVVFSSVNLSKILKRKRTDENREESSNNRIFGWILQLLVLYLKPDAWNIKYIHEQINAASVNA